MSDDILRYLFRHPNGRTCREIETDLKLDHDACLDTLKELVKEHNIMIGGWKTEDDWDTMSAIFWFLTG